MPRKPRPRTQAPTQASGHRPAAAAAAAAATSAAPRPRRTRDRTGQRRAQAGRRRDRVSREAGFSTLEVLAGAALLILVASFATVGIRSYLANAAISGSRDTGLRLARAIEAAYPATGGYPADTGEVAANLARYRIDFGNQQLAWYTRLARTASSADGYAFCIQTDSTSSPDGWTVYTSTPTEATASGKGPCPSDLASAGGLRATRKSGGVVTFGPDGTATISAPAPRTARLLLGAAQPDSGLDVGSTVGSTVGSVRPRLSGCIAPIGTTPRPPYRRGPEPQPTVHPEGRTHP